MTAERQRLSQPLDVYACPLTGTALIEASAGTGKTWAICALVLRLVLEKALPIDQVLVVTFTNAATAELRERVRARLVETRAWLAGEAASSDPFVPRCVAALEARGLGRATLRARLDAALAAFDAAPIFTIHGFCQRALGEHPFAAGAPFSLELGDSRDLLTEVVADFWRLDIAHGALPQALVVWLAARGLSPARLEKLLQRALQRPLARPLWPDGLEDLPPPDTVALTATWAAARSVWQAQRHEVAECLTARAADLKHFDLEAALAAWDSYFAAADALADPGDKAAQLRQSVLTEKKTRARKTPPEHAFFTLAEQLCAQHAALTALFEQHRLALYRRFLAWAPAQVAERKRARHRVDFDDLLANLYRALSGPRGASLAASLRERYPAALIDEFQDTDPLQFAIFSTIYGAGAQPVFWVGDPKQAIYSFRQADLHTYLAAREHASAHYHLEANQRSSAALIAGINAIFQANPRAFMLAGLEFRPTRRGEKPLPPFSDTSGVARGALHCWQLPDADAALLPKEVAMQRAAAATAAEIARLLAAARAGQVQVGAQPLRAGRVAVLVRTHAQGRLMKAALARLGLQAAERAQDNVFASSEAEDMERLLCALLEPARPDRLKAALATPLLGFDATRIAALDADDAALAEWIGRFAKARQRWQERGISVALAELDETLGLSARLLRLPQGERRLTNHLHLLELLHQAEIEAAQPVRLLRWLARQRRDPSADETAQLRLESDQDLLNIVTIHTSKGLEYDLVFCPFLWEGGIQARSDGLPGHAYHDATGALVFDYRPEAAEAAKAAAQQEQAAEILRLYYVALTRAVHRCYLVCGPYGRRHRDGLSRAESQRSLLNWLVAGAGMAPEAWLQGDAKALPDAAMQAAAWQNLAACPEVMLEPLPEAEVLAPPGPDAEKTHAARVARRALWPDWRIDSFSGLLRGATPLGHDGSDHDALVAPAPALAAVPVAASDVLHFPRGARAGDCLHQLFEQVDFCAPATWDAAIASALARHPPGDPGERARHAAMLATLLADVLATPLALPGSAAPLRLADLPWARRRVEMEFHLPTDRLEATALAARLAAHGEPVPRLACATLQGFLKGYVDLVFEHAGRYYVLDWKSNHLGWDAAAYAPDALATAMAEHGYYLQARLYLLALHRFLAFRLPDYDPARHLGGAAYLFVRAVRPDWRLADGSQAGVCLLAPKPELILELEGLLN